MTTSRWQKLLNTLDSDTRKTMENPERARPRTIRGGEDGRSYYETMAEVDPGADLVMDPDSPQARAWPKDGEPAYCLVECPDGELPSLRIFASLTGLLDRMYRLDGEDVSVWPFYGIPISFSQGTPRVIFPPDRKPMTIEANPKPVDEAEQKVTIQDDGFLGPPEMGIESRLYEDDDPLTVHTASSPASQEQDEDEDEDGTDDSGSSDDPPPDDDGDPEGDTVPA